MIPGEAAKMDIGSAHRWRKKYNTKYATKTYYVGVWDLCVR